MDSMAILIFIVLIFILLVFVFSLVKLLYVFFDFILMIVKKVFCDGK